MADDNQTINIHPEKFDPLDTYVSSALNTKPSVSYSLGNSLASGLLSTGAAAFDISDLLTGKHDEENIKLHSVLEALDEPNKNVTSSIQKGLDFAGNLVGQVLSLGPIGGEKIAGSIAKSSLPLFEKLAPAAITNAKISKLGLQGLSEGTAGQLAASSYKSAASFAGFTLPQSIDEAYNPETNKFNFNKAAISVLANGALGAAIPAIPYLSGVLSNRIGKIFDNIKEETSEIKESDEVPISENPTSTPPSNAPATQLRSEGQINQSISRANQALKNRTLTPEEHQWFSDLTKNPRDPTLNKRAINLLDKMNYKTNNSHVYLDLLGSDAVNNLEKVVTDQLFSDLENTEKTSVSDFIIHNETDKLKLNPELPDGMDGWIKEADNILSKKSDHLNTFDLSGSPSDLKDLHDQLFKDGKLKKNFDGLKAYYKLRELAPTSENAKRMLDKVHLENSYLAQKSYRDVLAAYRDILKSNLKRIANPDRSRDYLKAKIDYNINKGNLNNTIKRSPETPLAPEFLPESNKVEPISTSKDSNAVSTSNDVNLEEIPSDTAKISNKEIVYEEGDKEESQDLKESIEIENIPESGSKNNYVESNRRFKQFKKSKSALDNLIKCVLGSNNGEI